MASLQEHVASGLESVPDDEDELVPLASVPDPFVRVLALGRRASRTGVGLALSVALGTHGYASLQALGSLLPLQRVAQAMTSEVHDYLWSTYDIDLPPPTPKADEPPPPPPEPEPKAVFVPLKEAEPAEPQEAAKDEPPPPPAEAAAVLTAPSDDEPLDLTGQGFVTGNGTGPAYGMVSAEGTGNTPTWNRAANNGGVPGGTGTGAPSAPAATGPDRSRAAGLVGGVDWACPFPEEANVEGIDQALAVVVVTVRPDGTALSVKVVNDPGHGFGTAARLCALSRRFEPALDRAGTPSTGTTPPIRVRFTR